MIELTELKLVTASNIINQRTKAGMTQAELGAKLNYSDKSVSKWERGEAIPDAYVLSEMAELFGVTVDYLLSSHDGWEPPKEEKPEEEAPKYSVDIIIAIAILGIWTMSLTAFVVLWLLGTLWWPVFAVALTVSLLTYMVLLCVFKRTKYLQFVIAAFVLSIISTTPAAFSSFKKLLNLNIISPFYPLKLSTAGAIIIAITTIIISINGTSIFVLASSPSFFANSFLSLKASSDSFSSIVHIPLFPFTRL